MIKSYKTLLARMQKDGFHIHSFYCDRGLIFELVNPRDSDRFVSTVHKASFNALLRKKFIQKHDYKKNFYVLAPKPEEPKPQPDDTRRFNINSEDYEYPTIVEEADGPYTFEQAKNNVIAELEKMIHSIDIQIKFVKKMKEPYV